MNRAQLEHLIEEVGRRTGLEYFYIIGASAVLAVLTDSEEAALIQTRDMDVVPGIDDPDEERRISDQIDWVLGEGSEFEIEHHYYAQGLSSRTPQYAPGDWMGRALPVKVGAYTGLCMEVHDLALSKFGAGRPKDLEFNAALVRAGLISEETLLGRLENVVAEESVRELMRVRVLAAFKPG